MMGQPGSFNPGFNLDVDTWYHAVLVHTGTFGATINSGGSYVNGTSYEIVALGDQNDAYWESINADSGAGVNDHEVGSKFIQQRHIRLNGLGTSASQLPPCWSRQPRTRSEDWHDDSV